jgi:transposase
MGNITIGLDVGDRFSQICAVDQDGAVVREERVPTTRGALRERFPATAACRVIVEAGTHAGWISRELAALGHEVIVANSRKLRWLYHNEHKTDRVDATYLARVGRWDPTLLAPIRVRSASADGALRLLRARASLVRARTRLINHVRGAVKSVGCQLPPCDATSFARRVATHVPAELHLALQPLLAQVAGLTQTIARYDRQIEHSATHDYPHTARLRQVTGVGALTALAFVLTVDDPQRFANGRAVGAYFGLCPRRADSGGQRPQLGITKCGDGLVRQLLVQAAHYILGPFGPDCRLRRWGLELARRGGKNAKKRAIIAVARKLAALLYSLWVHDTRYAPQPAAPERHDDPDLPVSVTA